MAVTDNVNVQQPAQRRAFPPGFLFGASTSAYQVEGAAAEDGRGRSIWDSFCQEPGRIAGGGSGQTACDHYHRVDEDQQLAAGLGLNAYRFSIAWPRIFPEGHGPPNPGGLSHYDREIDGLAARGITPVVTLYHWDLPQALQDQGGWVSRSVAERFGEFAATCFEAFGDRAQWWVSICEPWIVSVLGYELGVHAPGHTDVAESVRAAHHLLLGHGRAAAALSASGRKGSIGVAHSLFPHEPASERPEDIEASWASDGYVNRWYLEPLQKGRYPQDMYQRYEAVVGPLDFVRPGDLEAIGARSDFIGVNYYTRRRVQAAPEKHPWPWAVLPAQEGGEVTDAGWEIVPRSFTDLLVRLQRDYDAPLLVTENGAVFNDGPGPDGRVHDSRRARFIYDHLCALLDAVDQGAHVLGYCHWALIDNFEWALGYEPRFGLTYVDYATQARTVKDSGFYYGSVAATGLLGPPA